MRNKKNLKGRKEKIMEDWTWKERKMRWRLKEIAKNEERKGKKVWIEYGKIKIDEQWWKWDEEKEVLKNGKGNIRRIGLGEDHLTKVEGIVKEREEKGRKRVRGE